MFYGRLRNILIAAIVIIIGGYFVSTNIRTSSLMKKMYKSMGENNVILNQVESSVKMIGDDLTDTRDMLGLRTRFYGNEDEKSDENNEEGNEVKNYPEYYRAVDFILTDFASRETERSIAVFLEDKSYLDIYKKNALTAEKDGKELSLISDGHLFFTVYADEKTYVPVISTFDGSEKDKITSSFELESFVNKHYSKTVSHYQKVIDVVKKVESVSKSREIAASFKEKNIFIKYKTPNKKNWGFDVNRSDGSVIFDVNVSYITGEITINKEKCSDLDFLQERMADPEKYYDIRTAAVKKADDRLNEIKTLSEDSAFEKFLSARGCILSGTPAESEEYFNFSITDKEGNFIGSISLRKNTGELYIFDKENVVITSFSSLESGLVKKN